MSRHRSRQQGRRQDVNFTLKTRPLARDDLNEFVDCHHGNNRFERTPTWSPCNETGHCRSFTCNEMMARDKANLDIFWLRDDSLEDSANLPAPKVLAAEIVEDLRAALEQFGNIAAELSSDDPPDA
jgi:type I restriction enzyme M protein